MMTIIRSLLCSAILMAGGCVSVLPKTAPPAPRYTITAVNPTGVLTPVNWSLIVADPTSSQLYNTTKVALTRQQNRFEFYANTEWVDRAPVLFQRAVVRSFENSGQILNIGDYSVVPVGDYVLKTDMRAFHVDYTSGTPEVVVSIYARLMDQHGKHIAVQNFQERERVNADAIASVMQTFDASLERVLQRMVSWTFDATQEQGNFDAAG